MDMRWRCQYSVGGRPLLREEAALLFPPPLHRRGVMQMVTYSDLIQIGILVVGIINLFLSNSKKK